MATIKLRNFRDLNSKMKGEEVYQQIAYASEGWATFYWLNEAPSAINVGPRMPPRGIRAHERKCSQTVEIALEVGDMRKRITKGAGYELLLFCGVGEDGEGIWKELPNREEAAKEAARAILAEIAPAEDEETKIRKRLEELDAERAELLARLEALSAKASA